MEVVQAHTHIHTHTDALVYAQLVRRFQRPTIPCRRYVVVVHCIHLYKLHDRHLMVGKGNEGPGAHHLGRARVGSLLQRTTFFISPPPPNPEWTTSMTATASDGPGAKQRCHLTARDLYLARHHVRPLIFAPGGTRSRFVPGAPRSQGSLACQPSDEPVEEGGRGSCASECNWRSLPSTRGTAVAPGHGPSPFPSWVLHSTWAVRLFCSPLALSPSLSLCTRSTYGYVVVTTPSLPLPPRGRVLARRRLSPSALLPLNLSMV
jgi:hypothetical protein